MKKSYLAPRIYAEDLNMSPFITGDCEETIFHHATDTPVDIEFEPDTVLLHATSTDCVGWCLNLRTMRYGWTFHYVSLGVSVCNNILENLPEGADPQDVWGIVNECYHNSYWYLGTTFSS